VFLNLNEEREKEERQKVEMKREPRAPEKVTAKKWLSWIVERFFLRLRHRASGSSRLALLERIAVGPHQSIALIEVQGHRLLVASSTEGAPTVYPLKTDLRPNPNAIHLRASRRSRRVSW
jgi:hypothetical protein